MLCDECRERPATVHLTRITNGNKQESHLCEYCAQKKGEMSFVVDPGFSINEILKGLLNHEIPTVPARQDVKDDPCPNCGLSYGEFARVGRLGCDVCYSHFEKRLDPLLKRIHAAGTHSGKVPQKAGTHVLLRREIERLREDLKRAVQEEQYEMAAQIRDHIREIEGRVGNGGR